MVVPTAAAMASGFPTKPMLDLSCCLTVAFCAFFVPTFAKLTTIEHSVKTDGSLSFLVIGDWGRRGLYNQSEVAFQMGRIGEKLDIDFVISTGDNFYDNGLTSVYDPAFRESFTNIYTAKSLHKQWYNVLGNHDYRGNVEAQLGPILPSVDKRWICMRSFAVKTEIVDIFFLDTTPFVDKYFIEPEEHTYDWEGVQPRKTYLATLLKDLKAEMRDSTAKWKFVVGHHAIKSLGHHGDTTELVKFLLPLLKENNVDVYMNGHDHCLGHITSIDGPIQYLTSGGGSKAWRGVLKTEDDIDDTVKFLYDGQGFMSVEMNERDVMILFYDVDGNVLHDWKISKLLYSAV
ncbi:purple acid phosphatase 4-like [Hibiscus syriacus]|nr:purple acid phosphatase 4-like [Hibiscus syriacus]